MIVRAYLHDEAPAIGAGWRRVIVEREGRIWVRLIDPNTLKACTVRRSVWDKVGARSTKQGRHELRKSGLKLIEVVDQLKLGVADEKSLKEHTTRIAGMKSRLRRALKAL